MLMQWGFMYSGVSSGGFHAMRDGHFPTIWNITASIYSCIDPQGSLSIISIPGYFDVKFLAGNPNLHYRWIVCYGAVLV